MFARWILLTLLFPFLLQLGGVWLNQRDPLLEQWTCYGWSPLFAQPERLLLHGWLHSTTSPWHLLLNGIGIFYLGRDVEKEYGTWKTVGLFVGGIVVGGLLWKILPAIGAYPKWRLIGCSAGVCALFAVDALSHQRRKILLETGWINISGRTSLLFAFGFEILCWQFGWWGFIAHTAHLGGLFAGILFDQLLHFSEARKKVDLLTHFFSNTATPLMKRHKIILITLINCLIVAYLGYLVWDVKKPAPRRPVATQPIDSAELLIQKALGPGSFQERLQFLKQIPPQSSLAQLQPLLSCLSLRWAGYPSFTLLEKNQWISVCATLLNQNPETRLLAAQALEYNLSEINAPLILQNQSYLQLCNGLILSLTELSKSPQSIPLSTAAQKNQLLFETATATLEKQKKSPLLPLQIQAKTYLRTHYQNRFPYPNLERELTALVPSPKNPEKVRLEALRALAALKSTTALPECLQLLKEESSIALRTEALHLLSSQGNAETIYPLSLLQPTFPDEQEILLQTIQAIRTRNKIPAPSAIEK